MRYEDALARIPVRTLPPFWVGGVSGLDERWHTLARGTVQTLATTPGGRPLYMVTYGDREATAHRANYNSAVGARDPSAYVDKAARTRPVLLLVGPVHGHETEGLTGLVNLIQVMETGADLRGVEQRALRALGDRCRLLIVPAGNPDGVARFAPRALYGMALDDIRFWGQGTWADGTFCDWPACKARHPMRGEDVGFLGCYYNDEGINPMHDEFTAPMGPEAAAILDLARAEGPALAVSLHSHQNPPALLRPAYVPLETQDAVSVLAERTYRAFDRAGLPHGAVFRPQAERGLTPASFNLTSALHHVSGAMAFTFECPHGIVGERAWPASPDQILEVQLILYQTMLEYALEA